LHVSLDWLISHSHTAQMQSKITESLSRTTGRGTSGQQGAFLYLFIYFAGRWVISDARLILIIKK